MTHKFTFKQLADWRRYENVRLGGRWNMYFPQARAATGLTPDEYVFAMQHYDALKAAALEDDKGEPEVPAGYTAEELERDNPYNQWMQE